MPLNYEDKLLAQPSHWTVHRWCRHWPVACTTRDMYMYMLNMW